jgi:hypothetical protein
MDLSVHYALGSDPFDPHDISWLGGGSLRCSTVFWLPAIRSAALRGALGYGPATTQRSTRSTSLGLASLLKFECREPDPSTVKRAARWQQGPAFVAQFGGASEGRQDPRHRQGLHRRVLVEQGFGR